MVQKLNCEVRVVSLNYCKFFRKYFGRLPHVISQLQVLKYSQLIVLPSLFSFTG